MIYLGSDHAGFSTKEAIKKKLGRNNVAYQDLGTDTPSQPSDYPDIAKKVAKEVQKSESNQGILICGTGAGMAMAANKLKGIRAACVWDNYTAVKAKEHNMANIITLSGRDTKVTVATGAAMKWLKSSFSGELRHKRRIKKIQALEESR